MKYYTESSIRKVFQDANTRYVSVFFQVGIFSCIDKNVLLSLVVERKTIPVLVRELVLEEGVL